jgi:hypothetical protein
MPNALSDKELASIDAYWRAHAAAGDHSSAGADNV